MLLLFYAQNTQKILLFLYLYFAGLLPIGHCVLTSREWCMLGSMFRREFQAFGSVLLQQNITSTTFLTRSILKTIKMSLVTVPGLTNCQRHHSISECPGQIQVKMILFTNLFEILALEDFDELFASSEFVPRLKYCFLVICRLSLGQCSLEKRKFYSDF